MADKFVLVLEKGKESPLTHKTFLNRSRFNTVCLFGCLFVGFGEGQISLDNNHLIFLNYIMY